MENHVLEAKSPGLPLIPLVDPIISFVRVHKWFLVGLGVLYLSTRLPFLFLGYGVRNEAWGAARAARSLLESGTYEVGRYPGYVLHELVNVPLVLMGSWATIAASALIYALALVAVIYILQVNQHRHPRILLVLFVFFPLFWLNSVENLDYVWNLAAHLIAFALLLSGRTTASAIVFGIGVGFRLSSAVMIAPFALQLWLQRKSLWALVTYGAIAGVVGAAPYALVLGAYGITAFRPHILPSANSLRDYILSASATAESGIGQLSVFLLVIGTAATIPALVRQMRTRPSAWVYLAMIVTSFGSWVLFRLLGQNSFLSVDQIIPAFAFLLFLLDLFWSKALLVLLLGLSTFTGVWIVRAGNLLDPQHAEIQAGPGPILTSTWMRRDYLTFRQESSRFVFPPRAVVVYGSLGSILTTDNPQLVRLAASYSTLQRPDSNFDIRADPPFWVSVTDPQTGMHGRIFGEAYKQKDADIYYVYLLDGDAARIFAARGYAFYHVSGSDRYNMQAIGFDLNSIGSRKIGFPVSASGPRP